MSSTNARVICGSDRRKSTARQHENYRYSITQRICARLVPSRAHDFFIPLKAQRDVKPEFRKFVKSQTPTLTSQERTRLQNAAKIMTVEERLDALAKKEEISKQQHEQAERARNYFREIDERRLRGSDVNAGKGERENTLETGDKQKTLDIAFIAKQEQEEEVKAVNRFILDAKCQAVRDTQVEEKKNLERSLQIERIRLERIVIDEAARALATEDSLAMSQKNRCNKYASEIRDQLLQRENLRFIEAERTVEEAKALRACNAAIQQEEELKLKKEKERRRKFRADLDRIVEMSNLFKKMLCEQERETDLRVAAYMREKRNREEQLEREKKLARDEFERKQQLLYEIAQKRMASKSQREELSYLREQEHAEREYRRREKEAALRRKQLEDDIKESRQRQSQEMKTRQALQIAREEKDFLLMIENMKKEEERLKKQEQFHKKQRDCYLADIKRQISDKAVSRRRMLEIEQNEANIWREAERKRLEGVRAVIEAKLSAMRQACLPEHYIKDIERQVDRIIKRSSLNK